MLTRIPPKRSFSACLRDKHLDFFQAISLFYSQKNDSDVRLDDLDYDFISEYAFYLKAKRNISHNVAMKYLVYFKKIVLIGVKKGWLLRDPFIEFSLARRDADRFPLDVDELAIIEDRHFGNERLANVKNTFVFCCYTGLSYADVKNLSNKNISNGFDGRRWITIKRQKTDVPSRIPLLPVSESILNKYAQHIRCQNGHVLPVLSNQKMNAYLKEIGDICGITREITFQLALNAYDRNRILNQSNNQCVRMDQPASRCSSRRQMESHSRNG